MTAATTVSTHILDTSAGRPARGVPVELASRTGGADPWTVRGSSATDPDGRCKDLPALPEGTTHVRLLFDVEPYLEQAREGERGAFFPEVAVTFAVSTGEHYHVPLLLNPFGYSVYRGS